MNISFARLRQVLKEELEKYEGNPVLFPYDVNFLDKLLFEYKNNNLKEFQEILKPVLTKINYSNISFNNFSANNFDFSPYVGIKINPQMLSHKHLSYSKCKGVEFIGTFDGAWIKGTDFTGSKGAKIDPQKIAGRDLSGVICADIEFICENGLKPDFTNVDIIGTNFNGSNYEQAIREEYEFREKVKLAIYGNNKIEY